MNRSRVFPLLGALLLTFVLPAAWAAKPSVVATIGPIHSLVAGVMEGVGKPQLLIKGGASPHSYVLRPSDVRALNGADLVFRVGENLETFLNKTLKTLPKTARVVELAELKGVKLLEVREGGVWDAHDHDHGKEGDEHADHEDHEKEHASHDEHEEHEKEHAAHDEHEEHEKEHAAHDEHEDHEKEHASHDEHEEHEKEHASHDEHDDHEKEHAAHDEHDDHDHHGHDPHVWLDPASAKVWVKAIAEVLGEKDTANRTRYQANAAGLIKRLEALENELNDQLSAVREKPYVVFHDAYQYFEKRFDMHPVGSISVSDASAPGARRLSEIRHAIRERGALCVFAEPQFEPRLVKTVIEGSGAKSGVLDPLGAQLTPGPEFYFTLLRELSRSLVECLES